MQLIGPYLAPADPRSCDLNLNKNQLAYLQSIEKEKRHTSDDLSKPEMQLLTGEHAYTLHYIPVPVIVKTVPGKPVYFEAINGGHFKQTLGKTSGDGLSLAKVIANQEGIAEIAYYTEGDATGYMEVIITSPDNSNYKIMSVEVQKLIPKPLTNLADYQKKNFQSNKSSLLKHVEKNKKKIRERKNNP